MIPTPLAATEPTLDIIGIGNAIVDVLARADEAALVAQGMVKGTMQLIDAAAAESLYATMGPAVASSGGSAANTCAVAAGLGARVAFLGKVADDELGRVFDHDIRAAGVDFPTPALPDAEVPTARCLILITPDGQRTMNTFLGACVRFGPDDVPAALIASAQVTYLEGYLFDPPAAQQAFVAAAEAAHLAGRRVALTLSDPFCVERHRAGFLRFVAESTDILFANEAELLALYETPDLITGIAQAREQVGLAAITRGARGSLIVTPERVIEIEAVPTVIVDTTGAGDAYAAGFLAALTQGLPLEECGRWASVAAAAVIAQIGARPQVDLKAMVGS